MNPLRKLFAVVFCLGVLFATPIEVLTPAVADSAGVTVAYQLPTTGPLPRTYRVTLAIVDPKNPNWIISQFVAGAPRTVTADNGGKFTETWNGLDDNFMPVPPGEYGVKGIYMPASKWDIDGQYHSIVAKYITCVDPWRAEPGENKVPIITGDPVNTAIGDVDVGANGIGVFCYGYLENSKNFYVADFNKPINYDQVLASYGSGGAAGGEFIATDGYSSWCCENSGFIFRTDGKPFSAGNSKYRDHVFVPDGYISAMAAWRDTAAGKSYVYATERGRLVKGDNPFHLVESPTDKINKLLVLDGDSAQVLATLDVSDPAGLVARWGDKLWILQKTAAGYEVDDWALKNGLPDGDLKQVMTVPAAIHPTDLEVDSHGHIYLADGGANHVYQFSPEGKPLLRYGQLDVQKPASYDPNSFMNPEKISCWRDAGGHDHLIVVEKYGPDRVTEWSADDGTFQREWQSALTYANQGYAVDPRNPDTFYIQGHGGYLMRYRVNYDTGAWTLQAVWPNVCTGVFNPQHYGFPRVMYHGDTRYLVWPHGQFIYREDGDNWLPSAAIFTQRVNNGFQATLWHDANGDGQVQDDESVPTTLPPGTARYFGNTYLDDFSYVALGEGTTDVWRLPVDSWDAHGNPVYKPDGWTKLLTDPVLQARHNNTETALFGGNEITDKFSSAWGLVEGNMTDGFYVNSRGPDISANFGAQEKLTHYVPDGNGGFKILWRVGRMAIHGTAEPGEVYGSLHMSPPLGGLITQVDQSRMGMVLYNEDGLYVDTLFADERIVGKGAAGPYTLPGEFFAGYSYLNSENNKVYFALGKTTPAIFEAEGWTGTSNPVHTLDTVQKSVIIPANQISPAPEFALALRHERDASAGARVAHFSPLPGGGPALDGTMAGWEGCEPAVFTGGDTQNVEVRCGYDPDNLYLRWHARLGHKLDPKPLDPANRIFTHDRMADTLSFYIQGDPGAAPPKDANGRPGDARFVFGLFEDGGQIKPVALGMYPSFTGPEKPEPITYRTAAGGGAPFQFVGLLPDVKMGYTVDADGEGFVLAAAIPKTRVPALPGLGGAMQTQVNFDATLGGHNRFWWANADGSATKETYDEPTEARLYPGSWSQAQFEAMDGLPIRTWSAIGPFGFARLTTLDSRNDRQEICRTMYANAYPPQTGPVDLTTKIRSDMTQTRVAMRTLSWRPANISGETVSMETVLGWKGYEDEGTAYLVTWIHAPEPTTVTLKELDGHGQHALRAWVNDVPQHSITNPGQPPHSMNDALDPNAPVNLTAGWNKLLVRWDLIWGENSFGVKLVAPAEKLWTLQFTATPPPGMEATGPQAPAP